MQGYAATLAALGAAFLLITLPAGATPYLGPAAIDPTPGTPDAVRATYSTRLLESLEGFAIDIALQVHEIETVPFGGRTASELRGAPAPLQQMFEDMVQDAILAETQRVLGDARVELTAFTASYGVEDYDMDPYEPPVQIVARVAADFTPQFFGLPPSFQTPPRDVARAFLYSGGAYQVDRVLEVPPGYDVRHVINVPPFLVLDGAPQESPRRVELHRDNFQGATPSLARLDFAIRLPAADVPTNVLTGPVVNAQFLVDDRTPLWKQSVPFLGGDYAGQLDLDIQVHSLRSDLFTTHPLPRDLQLDHISADLLRMTMREGLVGRDDVERFFDRLIRQSLEQGFGPDVELSFDWDTFGQSLNAPIGGVDGAEVRPLVVQARAHLPFASNKMFVSSSLGRLFGMTVGMTGDFELSNDGMWDVHYTVAYPQGVSVQVRDSAGLVQDHDWAAREGFDVYLAQGARTQVHVQGRSDFEPLVFALGLAEFGLLAWFAAVVAARARPLFGRTRGPIKA